jgi:N-methylhydantoinase B
MTNGYVTLENSDDRLILEFPSGAGVGDPTERPSEQVARDVGNGLVSEENAKSEYGHGG